jgi:nucleoside diphosphate kinase
MAVELTYVLVNPYTLRKSRTGGILARVLTRTSLDLVASRLFAPTAELVQEYAATLLDFKREDSSHQNQVRRLIHAYVLKNYSPDPITGKRHRVLMWLFKGENAVAKIRDCVGDVSHRSVTGETIRDTYGDYVLADNGQVAYFEPAVLAPRTSEDARKRLAIWAKHSDKEGGLLRDILPYKRTKNTQRALVIIKPDNFKFPSAKPGNVMDMFSKTGLYVVAFKVNRMSVAQAEQFYGPVLDVLKEKFKSVSADRAKDVLGREFGFQIPEGTAKEIGDIMGPVYAKAQFEDIVRFMSGRRPSECKSKADKMQPGTEKSIVIVYEGENAVAKVREVLGPTDPRKAPPGSIRREFGRDIMVNAAHASDSPENAQREMKIVDIEENNFKAVIEEFYSSKKRKKS